MRGKEVKAEGRLDMMGQRELGTLRMESSVQLVHWL